jgi:hypothetical protein
VVVLVRRPEGRIRETSPGCARASRRAAKFGGARTAPFAPRLDVLDNSVGRGRQPDTAGQGRTRPDLLSDGPVSARQVSVVTTTTTTTTRSTALATEDTETPRTALASFSVSRCPRWLKAVLFLLFQGGTDAPGSQREELPGSYPACPASSVTSLLPGTGPAGGRARLDTVGARRIRCPTVRTDGLALARGPGGSSRRLEVERERPSHLDSGCR